MDLIAEIMHPVYEGVIEEPIFEGELQVGVPVTVQYDDHIDSSHIAGETLGTNQVVYLKNDGRVWKASASNLNHAGKVVGLTTSSGMAGASIRVRKLGAIHLNSWGLIPNANYYLGENGAITLTKPTSGFIQCIGIARTGNDLEIQLFNTLIRG